MHDPQLDRVPTTLDGRQDGYAPNQPAPDPPSRNKLFACFGTRVDMASQRRRHHVPDLGRADVQTVHRLVGELGADVDHRLLDALAGGGRGRVGADAAGLLEEHGE